MKNSYPWLGVVSALTCVSAGCNSFDDPGDDPSNQETERFPAPVPPGPVPGSPRMSSPPPNDGFNLDVPVIEPAPDFVPPTDARQPIVSATPPVPISGGTLHVTADGSLVVAADPDRDAVYVAELAAAPALPERIHAVSFEPGDEPGRIAEGPAGTIHVVLRRAGEVATLDPVAGEIVERRSVCRAPRGIAYEALENRIHVACADGKLVTLGAEGGEALRTLDLEPDLRDVMVQGSELWVTRFKSAELLRLDAEGNLLARAVPHSPSGINTRTGLNQTLEPAVAWRAVPTSEGGAVVVHQQAVSDEIDIADTHAGRSSPYGSGGFDCASIVRNAVTTLGPDGEPVETVTFSGSPLPVDIALSPDGRFTAVAQAGVVDPESPLFDGLLVNKLLVPSGRVEVSATGTSVFVRNDIAVSTPCETPLVVPVSEPVVAVAFTPDNRLLSQTLEPPKLVVSDPATMRVFGEVVLSAETRRHTGHELFHRDTGAGIACASCHPEGGEDGLVWTFSGIGERRTQALHVGLESTAPFHWDGDLENVGALMTEVFVGRMGGAEQSPERIAALEAWLFGIEPPPPLRDADDAAVEKGEALFQSEEVGCAACHSGRRFTNSESVAVGTLPEGGRLQVPSLVAIGYRAPFMHDGCAPTLLHRFDPACGGTDHGSTSALSDGEIRDLIAYLESL